MINKIIENIKLIKDILTADEYFICLSNKHVKYGSDKINYKYYTNSTRRIFYKFIKSYIEDIINKS